MLVYDLTSAVLSLLAVDRKHTHSWSLLCMRRVLPSGCHSREWTVNDPKIEHEKMSEKIFL